MSSTIKRVWFFLIFDSILSFVSLYIAYLLRFNFHIPEQFYAPFFYFFALLLLLKLTYMALFGVYKIPWSFFSLDGLEKIAKAHIATYLAFVAIYLLTKGNLYTAVFPRSVVIIDFALSMLLIGGLRISKRIILEGRNRGAKRAVIIGSNKEAELMARELFAKDGKFYPLFFVESDKNRVGLKIHSLDVVSFEKLPFLVEKYDIKVAIIADKRDLKLVYEKLESMGIDEIKIAKRFDDKSSTIDDISIEDLLARSPKDLDKEAIAKFVAGKRVLITGAGGSIGSELAKKASEYGAKSLYLVDIAEIGLYHLANELPSEEATFRLANVTDQLKMREIFEEFRPEIVLHAAAYKHVPLAEINPRESIQNNIIGTKTCIDEAIRYGAEIFVLVSTDKAVNPTSVMGATKRVCELYLQNVPSNSTTLTAVRFGNVLGSSGSVVPHFRELIRKDLPLTVTHKEMTRYFMLISEAVELVLQAASIASDRELFVLDMGEPVRIDDLAKKMLELSDKEHLGVIYTGLRRGEKLYEELLKTDEETQTKYPSIFVAKLAKMNYEELLDKIENLPNATDQLEALKRIVPEFNHNKEGK